jgi:hypothetical protein
VSLGPDNLVYLYGIVPVDSPEPPAALTGVEDAPVALVRMQRVAALVSEVPASKYSDEALNARLDDLEWVGTRGVSHERVLDWYAERGPVIPLSLFSLHRDVERLEKRVGAETTSFARVLERLAGHKEWGIKLWRRDSEAREGIDRLSPSLQALAREIEASPPGKRFLLERKRETMRTEEVRGISKKVAHDVFGALRSEAAEATTAAIPASAAGGERLLLLHAAFLIPDERFEAFQGAVNEQAARIAGSGFEIEFTGPWPPYHFTSLNDE